MCGERIVLPDDAELLFAVRRLDLFDRRFDARAERALEVAEHDDGDRRRAIAPRRIFAVDRHGRFAIGPSAARVRTESVTLRL